MTIPLSERRSLASRFALTLRPENQIGLIALVVNPFSTLLGPSRVAKARGAISSLWRRLFSQTGLYRPIPSDEKEIILTEKLFFKGDAPQQIASGANEQGRMAFRKPRPVWEAVDDLIVTPKGGGWVAGRFYECCSACEPGLRLLFEDHKPTASVDKAYVAQSAHKDTYGDWVSEYLCAIARAYPLDAPLLLPVELAQKDFVRRDLATLGVAWRPVEAPVKIRRAKVLRQQKFFVHFPPTDEAVLRRLFPAQAIAARPGGVVYLSRRGERSDVADRQYPSEVIEEVVRTLGGRVIRTAEASREDYAAAANDAETVIFDHGSAIYNAISWPVQRMIEVASDSWWNNSFLMMAHAVGLDDYTIIRGDLGEDHVRRRLIHALAQSLDTNAQDAERLPEAQAAPRPAAGEISAAS